MNKLQMNFFREKECIFCEKKFLVLWVPNLGFFDCRSNHRSCGDLNWNLNSDLLMLY